MLQQKMSRQGEYGNAFLRRWSPKGFMWWRCRLFQGEYDAEVDDFTAVGLLVCFLWRKKKSEEMMATSIGTNQITINLTSKEHCNYRIHQDPSPYLSCFVPMSFFKYVSKSKALPFSESQAIWYSWDQSTRNVGKQTNPVSCADLLLVTFSNLIFYCCFFEV